MFHLERRNRDRDLWSGSALFDKDLEKIFDVFGKQEGNLFAPSCEIIEEEKRYLVSVDVPGMKEEDISLEIKDNHLYITGERKFEKKTEKNNVLRTEKRYGKLSRTFTLPQDVNSEAIEASFESGVLEVSIPKTEKSQVRKIAIGTKSATTDGELKN